jgi:hypothetical protein
MPWPREAVVIIPAHSMRRFLKENFFIVYLYVFTLPLPPPHHLTLASSSFILSPFPSLPCSSAFIDIIPLLWYHRNTYAKKHTAFLTTIQ